MELISVTPIELCPINFKKLRELNGSTSNQLASLLLSRIRFYQNRSMIQRAGKTWIARSREELADWYGFGLRKVDALLASLVKKGLLEKFVSTFMGRKKIFLRATNMVEHVPIHISLLDLLVEATGSLDAALCFSKIAFSSNHSHILHQGLTWAALSRSDLAEFLEVSLRKIDSVLSELKKKGLILQESFVRNGKKISHFHIPAPALQMMKKRFVASSEDLTTAQEDSCLPKKVNASNCKATYAKTATFTKRTLSAEKENNKPRPSGKAFLIPTGTITFSDLEQKALSASQQSYFKSAFYNTLISKPISSTLIKPLWEEIKFSVLGQLSQRSFSHAMSRSLKIFREGHWKTPFGFSKFSAFGQAQQQALEQHIQQHTALKTSERVGFSFSDLQKNMQSRVSAKSAENPTLTEKALSLAEYVKRLQTLPTRTEADLHAREKLLLEHLQQLTELFKAGADKTRVREFLESSI